MKHGIGEVIVALAICLSIVCMGVSTGCGGGSNEPSTTPNGNTSSPNPPPPAPQSADWDPADFDYVYDVGPGQTYADPGEVPWEDLLPSTLVRIYYRDTPYRNKFVITTTALADAPLVVLGVPDGDRLPIISGEDAATRTTLYYLNEGRSVVKVGNYTGTGDTSRPAHVFIQNLDIRSGRPGYAFVDRNGHAGVYHNNAAAVHIEEGERISIVGCRLTDCGNGLFASHLTSDILLRQNDIFGNGIEGRIYEHNTYTESHGIVFEFNHYGPLRAGCLGNNLKDRSSGTVIRYNWIEGGNRQLDLVETDYDSILNDPDYDATFVYGNVLVEPDGAGNSQILHYGGDGANVSMYRQGTLYFYHNTVVSERSGNTTLMRLSTNLVTARVHNNILWAMAGGNFMAITSGRGQTFLERNWLPAGWKNTHEAALEPSAAVLATDNREGVQPGFMDPASQNFHLVDGAEAQNVGGSLPVEAEAYPVTCHYVADLAAEARPVDGMPDAGAFER